MRRILIEEARKRQSMKRGGGYQRVSQAVAEAQSYQSDDQHLQLKEALEELRRRDPRAYSVVEARFLLGHGIAKTAELLGVSTRTVRADWTATKHWLRQVLQGGSVVR